MKASSSTSTGRPSGSEAQKLGSKEANSTSRTPFFYAATHGIIEIVKDIEDAFPLAI